MCLLRFASSVVISGTNLWNGQILTDTFNGWQEIVIANDRQQGEEVNGGEDVQEDGSLRTLLIYKEMILHVCATGRRR